VRVEWEDIQDFSNDDWNDDSLEADTASIVSIGWVAKEYRGGRVLTNAKDFSPDDGQYRSVVAIPAGCVTAVQVLEVAGEVWDVGEE
jgi:hypothetical protein